MDNPTLKLITGLFLSYILGSLPTAYIFGRLTRGVDLRQHGSGNLGATNAFRVLGKGTGTLVLLLDIAKGTAAVLLAGMVFFDPQGGLSEPVYLCLSAVCAVAGHNWTIFLGFKGGKGIATSLGVLIAFSILIDKFFVLVFSAVTLWLALFLTTGFVSLASVICSVLLPIAGALLRLPVEITLFLLILGGLSVFRHKENIQRLLQNKENRFNTASFLKKLLRKK